MSRFDLLDMSLLQLLVGATCTLSDANQALIHGIGFERALNGNLSPTACIRILVIYSTNIGKGSLYLNRS